jgi:hypothetical protein
MRWDYLVGLDLGQASDFTALAVCEEPVWVGEPPSDTTPEEGLLWSTVRRGWASIVELLPVQAEHFRRLTYLGHRPSRPPLFVRHLERVRHVSYSNIVAKVAALLRTRPLAAAETLLLVDYGGPGLPVFDQLVQAGLRPVGIGITGGGEVHVSAAGWNVPKRDLVVLTQSMLQDGRLRIASGLEHAATLTRELLDYRVRISATGHDSYDAREGQHDDLVLAVSLACWFRDFYWQHHDLQAERVRRERLQEAWA